MKSLVFRVEHVYLIERDTGILIKQLSDSSAQALDSDAVSAMFSAIESFVNDSFSGEQGDRLTDLKVGERNVWVGHGPKLMLACVIFGDAPESLKADLRETLDQIRVAYASELNQANAGELLLADVDNYLHPILQSEAKESESEGKRSKSMILLGLVLIGLLGYGLFYSVSKRMTFDSLQSVLESTPGMLVTEIRQEDDQYFISGLRDPQTELPINLLSNIGIDEQQLEIVMRPFLSLEPEIEVRRFVKQLSPPEGVQVVYQDSKVKLLGVGSLTWAEKYSDRLMSLKRDGRISLTGFEVSAISVREMLLRDLGDNENDILLAGVVIKPKFVDGLNGLEIGGELSQAQRTALSRYFANNPWVNVGGYDQPTLLPATPLSSAKPSQINSETE